MQNWVRSCTQCRTQDAATTTRGTAALRRGAGDRWRRHPGADPPHKRGNQYVIVFSDYLTKWAEAFAMEKADGATVARILFEEIICRYGAPARLLSDRGSVFRSAIITELCSLFKTKKVFTSAYHPQTDGLVERFNHTLATMLSTYVAENQDDWDEYLQAVMFAYRRSLHETTQDTPFFLMFGREAVAPSDVAHGIRLRTDGPVDIIEWRTRLLSTIRDAQNKAREAIQFKQHQQKQEYDDRHRNEEFEPGEQVMLFNPAIKKGLSTKLSKQWTGPYRILERTAPQLYKLLRPDNKPLPAAVHVQRLKRYTPRVGSPPKRSPRPKSPLTRRNHRSTRSGSRFKRAQESRTS